jgi:hypothetical protein
MAVDTFGLLPEDKAIEEKPLHIFYETIWCPLEERC